MPLTIFVPFLFLLGAVALRLGCSQRPRLVQAVALLVPLIALSLQFFQVPLQHSTPWARFWFDDHLARVSLAVAATVPLVLGLTETSAVNLAAVFWGAGMLALSGMTTLSVVGWGAVQFAVLPILFYPRPERADFGALVSKHLTVVLGSLLLAAGLGLWWSSAAEGPAAMIGLVLVVCGLGGMLGWFPFPNAGMGASPPVTLTAVFGTRLFPMSCAAVLLLRLINERPMTTAQSNLLAMVALFSLTISGARLLREERLSRRLVLSSLATLSFLLVTVCLQNWEAGHPEQDWLGTSNLPGGQTLFLSILGCETAALLVLVAGMKLITSRGPEGDFSQTLAGAFGRHPWAGAVCGAGMLSLAGVPPFPGFWWRWSLISALQLPHRLSNVTKLAEVDRTFSLLALLLVLVMILNSLGHLRLLQQMLFEEPFRVPSERKPFPAWASAALACLLLGGAAWLPLSLGAALGEPRTETIVQSPQLSPSSP